MTKKKSKKKMIIIIIAVAVFILVQLILLGLYAGMGPFGALRTMKLRSLAGNAQEYEPSSVTAMENSPLRGETICFLGSSVTEGSASLGNSMAEYLGKRFDCNIVVEAVSGTTLVDNGSSSYLQRLYANVSSEQEFALFICQLSTNDATKKLPLGEVSGSLNPDSFDTSTIAGAMESIISYAQETWGCPVMFYTGSRYESAEYEAMVELLAQLQDKWGIGVIDLWHSDEFNGITDEQRELYMNDNIHPTMAGYRDWWVPEMEKQILAFVEAR